ncbi:MAG TPA: PilZ domain-containing protein [bacterium]
MAAGMSSRPERRRAPRIDERVPLALAGEDAEFQTQTRNLSASGVYCRLNRFIPPMAKLAVTLSIPDGAKARTVTCTGVVVRVEPSPTPDGRDQYEIAIFFSEITDRDRTAISRFVQQRLTQQPPTTV